MQCINALVKVKEINPRNVFRALSTLINKNQRYQTKHKYYPHNWYKYNIRYYQQVAAIKPAITADDRKSFMDMFPTIVEELKEIAAKYNKSPAPEWFERSIRYNVSHGKNNRGLLTILAFKELATESQLTPENMRRAQCLGWCTELLVGSLLALDDMVDSSETRRKQPCWYKLEDVGLQAINDCLMIENAVYFLVDKYFSDTDYHMKLLELYREATFATSIGQVLDYQASRENVTTFTMNKYKAICRTKSSYGTFSLPVFMAMFMCGITDPQAYKETDDILFEICYYFQTQNDFEDCYGDPKATGRVGTDIEDNRCTWMSVIAVEKANEKQKRILQESYGQRDPEKADKVRQVYNELGMVNLFATYEEDSYNYIKNMINIKSRSLKPDMFLRIWEQFYRKIAVKQ